MLWDTQCETALLLQALPNCSIAGTACYRLEGIILLTARDGPLVQSTK